MADAGNGQQAVVRFVPPLPPKKQQSHPNKQFAKNIAKYQKLYRKCYLGIPKYSQVEGVATNTSPFLLNTPSVQISNPSPKTVQRIHDSSSLKGLGR